jgi:AcrR family transcriptional regulator
MAGVKDSGEEVAQRRYHSPLRDENARETRARIIAAARELFLENGYASTSINDIATASGVARPTVLTVFGTKARLLRAVVDVAMAGNDRPVPVPQQPWFQPVWRATTGRECLDAYAHVCVLIGRRSAAVIELVRRASDEGDEIRAQWEELQRNRLTGARSIAGRVRELGGLRSGLTVARAGDRIWMANDSAHYLALVVDRGWGERAYEAWLAEQMRSAALDPAQR